MLDPKEARKFLKFARENNIEVHPDNEKLLCALAGMCAVCGKTRELNIAYDRMMCKMCEKSYTMKKGKFLLKKEEHQWDNTRLTNGQTPTDSSE